MTFDYCQFGAKWKKSTQVLAYNNKAFNVTLSRRCKVTVVEKGTICSRTGERLETLTGFVSDKDWGQY